MKFKCTGCKKVLTGGDQDSGRSSECPNCGKVVKIPYPGIGILGFWGYWFLIGIVGGAASGATGGLLLPVVLVFHMYLKYLRVINIGLHPQWTWFGLVPIISTLWFGLSARGSGNQRSKDYA
jgi:hypothetical protein